MIASETPALSPRVRGCAIVAVATSIVAVATAAALFFATDTFLVLDGWHCDGCIVRQRECIGFLQEEDLRDASRARCIGVPVGPWYCFKNVRSQDESVPVSCPPRSKPWIR